MKNLKALAFFTLALVLALGAAFQAARWLSARGQLAATRVVVAAVDIDLGTKVNAQMLTTAEWPAGSVPPGAFTEVAQLQDRVVKTGVARGEPLLERKLSPVGTQGGLSAVIAEGKRAMTVRVNDVIGVAGFALPGNYVDVMVNAQQQRTGAEQPSPVSMTVLEHVLVLAVAQEASRDETKPKVVSAVTLELAPADAEKLDLARSIGTLSLVLRNQLDHQQVATTGVTREQLLGFKTVSLHAPAHAPAPRPAAAARPAPAAHGACVEVIHAGLRQLDCF